VSDRRFDFSKLKRYSLTDRPSKVSKRDLAKPVSVGSTMNDFFNSLPAQLAGKWFWDAVIAVAEARKSGRKVHLACGAHVLKVGCGPIIADLAENGIITALSVNGAFLIHDFEIARIGFTSEDVEAGLSDGSFGMAEETAQSLSASLMRGDSKNLGLASSIAIGIKEDPATTPAMSALVRCMEAGVELTAHIALGTDIWHMASEFDFATAGRAAGRDFELFTSLISQLEGGVFLNIGSAVILPEVFLKALSAARNVTKHPMQLTTINMDFIQHYRPMQNVVRRPTALQGLGISLTGHHEIMLPLLAAAIKEAMHQR